MLYRTIKTDTWRDPWFHGLSPQAKCLFLYLFTNPSVSACGAMEITPAQIAFDIGIPASKIAAMLTAFDDKVLWLVDHNLIIVTNFYKHQRSQSSNNFTIAAKKAMIDLPEEARAWLGDRYPDLKDTHTHPIPNPSPSQGDKEELIATVVATVVATVEGDPPLPPTGEPKNSKRQPKQSPIPIPADFEPTPEMIDKACGKYGLTVDQVLAKTDRFKNWALAKGQTYANWDSGWLNFMEPKAWDGQVNGRASPNGRMSSDEIMAEAIAINEGRPKPDNVIEANFQIGGPR